MVEREIQAEKNQQPCGAEGADAAVLPHGIEHPVTRAAVPENAAGVSEKKSLLGIRCHQLFGSLQLQRGRRTCAEEGD